MNDLRQKYKIDKVYSYYENRKGDTISFGWVPSDLPEDQDSIVLSSISRSKKVSEADKAWSVSEGVSAASLIDYEKYFKALTGDSPIEFLKTWTTKIDELEEVRKRVNSRYRDQEGAFLLNLAELISDGKRFSKFGRVYKIIDINT